MNILRHVLAPVQEALSYFPAVAILGARQVGKTTIAQYIAQQKGNAIFLDMEKPSDRKKMDNPELYFEQYTNTLVCIDEVQRMPNLFETLRYIIDKNRVPGRFLLLGSASRDLLQQSSETLAGRIHYIDMQPFLLTEVSHKVSLEQYWFRGGFPDSVLAPTDRLSIMWANSFVKTYLERDIPQMGYSIPANRLLRFWQMLAHIQGQVVNLSQLGNSLGVSHTTIRNYLDLLQQSYLLRILQPWENNLGKRLVKSPKVYIRDTGLLHRMLGIDSFDALLGSNTLGASWETVCIENIIATLPDWSPYFYRTHNGSELDLILKKGEHCLAFELKAHPAPKLTKGFYIAIEDLKPLKSFVVCTSNELYPMAEDIWVGPLLLVVEQIRKDYGL